MKESAKNFFFEYPKALYLFIIAFTVFAPEGRTLNF